VNAHPWLQEGYTAEPAPAYRVQCERCKHIAVVFNDAAAITYQDTHRQGHENSDRAEDLRREAARRFDEGGRKVKIQRGSGAYGRFVIKNAETNRVISEHLKIEEALHWAEQERMSVVGWPRGYEHERAIYEKKVVES
jgi:hypothetical protein